MIRTVSEFIQAAKADLNSWPSVRTPWFRGESGNADVLLPRVFMQSYNENLLLQTFRRQAGGLLQNPPERGNTDQWLFLAQHYGVPTRLLDWTEGALLALYFAVNHSQPNPRVYMLNPHALNELATGERLDGINFPLSWFGGGTQNIRRAWENKPPNVGYELPIALPATFRDYRMLSQRSCFTVHGNIEQGLRDVILKVTNEIQSILVEYVIDEEFCDALIRDLKWLGISQTTIFPDLDNLGKELARFGTDS
jgi:hypothetical protein